MRRGILLLLLGLGLGCASQAREASTPSSTVEPSSQAASCSVACEFEGRPVSGSVTCREGFEAVCTCESLPNASCKPVALTHGQ